MRYDIDPVVEEIRDTRRKLYARCGNDPHKYGAFLAEAGIKRKLRLAKKNENKGVRLSLTPPPTANS